MARIIKFRALTKKNNVMVFGDLITCPNGEYRIIWFESKGETPLDVDYNDFNEVVQSNTIGQFTGIHDKNGKEIYEGDIVKHKDPKGYDSEKWEIIFYSGAFWIAGLPRKIRIYNVGERCNHLEIIGNINENNP